MSHFWGPCSSGVPVFNGFLPEIVTGQIVEQRLRVVFHGVRLEMRKGALSGSTLRAAWLTSSWPHSPQR